MKPQPLYRQPFHTLTVAESGAENRTPKHCRELERANTRGSEFMTFKKTKAKH